MVVHPSSTITGGVRNNDQRRQSEGQFSTEIHTNRSKPSDSRESIPSSSLCLASQFRTHLPVFVSGQGKGSNSASGENFQLLLLMEKKTFLFLSKRLPNTSTL